MVFWSSFSKKIKQAVSQISFDALKRRVETIETDYATKTYTDQQNTAQDTKINANTSNITNNANNINTLDTKVDGVISGLQTGNIVNYAGTWNSTTTFKLAQAVTHNGDWYVSTQNNNRNNQPSRTNSTYWVYISAPTVDLTPYLTKSSADSKYATISTVNQQRTLIDNNSSQISNLSSRVSTNSSNISSLQSSKASTSYVDGLIVFSNWDQLYNRLYWLNTSNDNNRNWKFVGRLDNNIVPQNLIDIQFELRGYDYGLTQQWYELISYGWYKTPFYTIVWFHSPQSQLNDYDLISKATYFRFVSRR